MSADQPFTLRYGAIPMGWAADAHSLALLITSRTMLFQEVQPSRISKTASARSFVSRAKVMQHTGLPQHSLKMWNAEILGHLFQPYQFISQSGRILVAPLRCCLFNSFCYNGLLDCLEDLVSSPIDDDSDSDYYTPFPRVNTSFLGRTLEQTTALQQALCWDTATPAATTTETNGLMSIMSNMRMLNRSAATFMLRGFTHLNINLDSWPLAGRFARSSIFFHSLCHKLEAADARPTHLIIISNTHASASCAEGTASCKQLRVVLDVLDKVLGSVRTVTVSNSLCLLREAIKSCCNVTSLDLGCMPSSASMWSLLPQKLLHLRCALGEGPLAPSPPLPCLLSIVDTSQLQMTGKVVAAVLRITPVLVSIHHQACLHQNVLVSIAADDSVHAFKVLMTSLDTWVMGGGRISAADCEVCSMHVTFQRGVGPGIVIDDFEPASEYLFEPYLDSLVQRPIKMKCKLDVICCDGLEGTRYISEALPNLVSLRLSATHTTAEDMGHLKHCTALQALRMDACHAIMYEQVKPLLLQLLKKQDVMEIVAVGCADLNHLNMLDLILADFLSSHLSHVIKFVTDEAQLLSPNN